MPFSRNPGTGKVEAYTDNGFYLGHVVTMGDLIGENRPESVNDGGPGSGNFGHKGRPGQVGGSGPGGGSQFAVIAQTASNTFDAAEFVAQLDAEQKERLEKQKRDTETEETFDQYAGRLQKAIKDPPKAPSGQHKVAEGKDLVSTYKYQGEETDPDAAVATKRVDTLIEDVIHQQGFDGVPKVVSKEEFDKITEEHPEMPVLMRTYAASNQEKLDEYSSDLESGFFYVDCGVGGKSYGSGMYTAGAYQGEPASEVLDWNDRELETDELGNWFPLKIKGEGYRAKAVFPEEAGDLFLGVPYVYESFKDGERHIYTMDEESFMWEDENGSLVPEEDLNEMIRLGEGTFYECEKMDLSVYYDKQNREKQEALQEASREMDKYVQSSLARVWHYEKPKTPPGMSLAREESEQQYYYYDPSTLKDIKENPPEDGKIIAVAGKEGEASLYRVKGNKIVKLDGTSPLSIKPQSFEYPVPDGWKWAEVGGKIEDYNPVATVRKMTLDPSAKIISSDDLFSIVNGNPTDNELEEAEKSYFDESVKGKTPDEIEYMRFVFGYPGYKEPTESNAYQTLCKKIDRGRRDELYNEAKTLANSKDAGTQGVFDMAKEREIMIRNKLQIPGDRIRRQPDQGVVAAVLGYDAISANLTEKLNYTIVLNRTKVIIQKEAA